MEGRAEGNTEGTMEPRMESTMVVKMVIKVTTEANMAAGVGKDDRLLWVSMSLFSAGTEPLIHFLGVTSALLLPLAFQPS